MILSIHSQRLRQVTLRPICSYASLYQSLRFQNVLSQPLSVALSFLENCRHLRVPYNRDHHAIIYHHIVHGNKQRRPL